MNDKLYDILKWTLLYNFDTTLIIGTISLVATFLGAITGISNINYKKKVSE